MFLLSAARGKKEILIICQTFHAGFMNFSKRKEHKSKAHIKPSFCRIYLFNLDLDNLSIWTSCQGVTPGQAASLHAAPFAKLRNTGRELAVTWRPDSLDTSDPSKNRDKCLAMSLYNLQSSVRSIVFYFYALKSSRSFITSSLPPFSAHSTLARATFSQLSSWGMRPDWSGPGPEPPAAWPGHSWPALHTKDQAPGHFQQFSRK